MEVKSFFNILLLGISLATVFITLVSFLVFKFKYNLNTSRRKMINKLDGSFFKRYSPSIDRLNQKAMEELELKETKRTRSPRLIVYTFFFVSALIVGILSTQNYLSYRLEIEQKMKDAELYKKLLSQGLLKSYDYNPRELSGSKAESISEIEKDNINRQFQELKKTNFVIWAIPSSKNDPRGLMAQSLWIDFFKRRGLNYQIYKNINKAKIANAVVVVPQARQLSAKEEQQLSLIIEKGAKIILTGPTGIINEQGKKRLNNQWIKRFGISFSVNNSGDAFFPSILRAGAGLPPGIQIPWMPVDNDYLVNNAKNSTGIYQSNRVAMPVAENAEWIIRASFLTPNIYWSMLDPIDNNKDIHYRHYADLYLAQQIITLVDKITIGVATWKNYQINSPLLLTVDTEDQFEKMDLYASLFNSAKLPATFFLVSSEAKKNGKIIEKWKDQFEWATHTSRHQSITTMSPEQLFNDIQQSRHDIEELSSTAVKGIRPPYELIDEKTIALSRQNHLRYIFGDQEHIRFSPTMIDQGKMVYFSRTLPDDILVANNKLLVSPEDFANYLLANYRLASFFGGSAIFSLHTQTFSSPLYLEAMKKFIEMVKMESGFAAMTLGEIASWWRQKQAIDLSLEWKGNSVEIAITNKGNEAVHKFDALIYGGAKRLSCPNWQESSKGDLFHSIEKLDVMQTLRFTCQSPLSQ